MKKYGKIAENLTLGIYSFLEGTFSLEGLEKIHRPREKITVIKHSHPKDTAIVPADIAVGGGVGPPLKS